MGQNIGSSENADEREKGGRMTIPEKLVSLRRKAGLLQQDVADELGVSRQTISNWENGMGAPDLYKAAKLAGLYGIDLDDLVRDEVIVSSAGMKVTAPMQALSVLVGRRVNLWMDDGALSARLSTTPVVVMSCNGSWIRVEYAKDSKTGSPMVEELIDLDDILGFSILEEQGEDR